VWRQLRAVPEARSIVADGNQYFNRPGPRLVESLEILAEVLHPGALPPQHRGVLRTVAVERSLRPHRSRSASFAGI
jgi:hypothetical protein